MKKAMISSGAVSTVALCAGVILKFMHLPGASILIVIGIFLMSFVFLPLMLALKIREDQGKTVQLVSAIGSFSAILLTLGVLFKIMHWPGATIMCILSLLIMLFVFIPIYFFTGIRNPQTKVNTIVSSIMMLTGCVLILVLIKTPQVSKQEFIDNTADFLQNEMIVRNEKMLMENSGMISKEVAIGTEIYTLCEELKIFLLTSETGQPALDRDFVAKNAILSDSWADVYFSDSPQDAQKLNRLNSLIGKYNKINADKESELPQLNSASRISPALNRLIQIQLLTLQDQRKMLAMN